MKKYQMEASKSYFLFIVKQKKSCAKHLSTTSMIKKWLVRLIIASQLVLTILCIKPSDGKKLDSIFVG